MSDMVTMGKPLLGLLRAVAAAATLLGCEGISHGQQYSFQLYGSEDGLKNLAVKVLFQDRTGFLWAATENGVFRFDGARFRRYGAEEGLPREVIVSLGEAPDGSVLAGSGVGVFALKGGRFQKMALPGGAAVPGYSSIVWDGKDRTYIASDLGLMVLALDGSTRRIFPEKEYASEKTHGLLVEKDSVWFGCGPGVCRLAADEVMRFGEADGLAEGAWTYFRRNHEGYLWTADKGRFSSLAPGARRFQKERPDLPPSAGGAQLGNDNDGRLLIPTTSGLGVQTEDGWRLVGKDQNLTAPVYSTLCDREGSIWMGLAGRGLARWKGNGVWESFGAASGLDEALVYEILPAGDGTVWVGTESGLFQGMRSEVTWRFKRDPRVGRLPVHSVRRDRAGNLWLGTEGSGVGRISAADGSVRWLGERDGLNAVSPFSVEIDRTGQVWAATENGIYVGSTGTLQFRRETDVPAIRFWTVAEGDAGDILAGSVSGLYWRRGGRWRHLTEKDGLLNGTVLAATARRGEVWAGYWFSGKLTRITEANGQLRLRHYGPESGIRGDMTYFVRTDAAGRLWSGTDQGVNVGNGETWTNHDQNSGLVWNDCDLAAFASNPDGSVWIGTSNGLARYTPRADSAPIVPRAVITDVLLGDRPFGPERSLPYHGQTLAIRYAGLTFAEQAKLRFRYRMRPYSPEWVETAARDLNFAQAQPGRYELEMQASVRPGVWGPVATEQFEISPPWWLAWWVKPAMALLALLAGAAIWRWRTRSMIARQRWLEQAVGERTRQLRELAVRDPLTGLYNRVALFESLNRELERVADQGGDLAFILADLDHFKQVNDCYGHQAGDAVLREAAARFTATVPAGAVVARYGGEELAVVLPCRSASEACKAAEAIRKEIARRPVATDAGEVAVTCSFGLALSSGAHGKSAELIRAADTALYSAKAQGRNCVVVTIGDPGSPLRLIAEAIEQAEEKPREREAVRRGD
jgi:diguanylate cyclase (GGDEF)-like protein